MQEPPQLVQGGSPRGGDTAGKRAGRSMRR
jgi:hypothetical protein